MTADDTKNDGVRDEFLAEAQEIVESLSRDLLVLDQGQKEGVADPELINEVFRGVHTLKGIAGMFGYHQVGAVAHALEDLLEDLRLGRVPLSQEVLDVLFEGVENFQRLLSDTQAHTDHPRVDLGRFAQSIEQVVAATPQSDTSLGSYDLDPGVLAVLTEYEEHRLRTNVEQGVPLYRLQVRFSLTSIDKELEELKASAKPVGEIITYLPSMEASDGEFIDLDVIVASPAGRERLQEAIVAEGAVLSEVPRRAERRTVPPAARPSEAPPTSAMPIPSAPPVPVSPFAPAPSLAAQRPPAPPSMPAPVLVDEMQPTSEEAGDALSLRSVSNTVRVDIRKLDHLMNVLGELAIVRSTVARVTERLREMPGMRRLALDLHRTHRSFERHLEELQDGILDVRMVPLRQVFDRLARVVRQVAREHEKEVRLVVTGADTEVDKLIVEELSDPLMHIIRNAIDHGIEKPKMRELADKAPVGTLVLNAYQKGNHVLIEVEDDGGGMNPDKLFETALYRGLVTEAARAELSRDEILRLIFLPGFSTRSVITGTSGRGFGMDVVKTNISRLGGVIDMRSEHGMGTKFTITLPITLAIVSALIIKVAGRTYAIPLTSVQEAMLLDARAMRTVEGRDVITLRGATLHLCRLDGIFGLERPAGEAPEKSFVVVCAMGGRRLGFVVDELLGQRDIIIKALGKSLGAVRGFAGATDLGDQKVALVLDAPALLEEVLSAAEVELRLGVGA